MNERAQAIALLLVTIAMLVVVCASVILRPARQTEVQSTRPVTYRINVNSADRDELSLLPDIAHGKAQRIVDNRQATGRFESAQDLTRVPMIGEKTAAAMAPYVRFD